MKILLAVDGSEYSQRAAAFLAKNVGALAQSPEIHCLHVHAPIPYPGAAKAVGKGTIEKYQREESEAALAAAKKELTDAKLEPKCSWCVGDVVEEIGRYVKKNKIDLIVIGSHGRSSFAALTLGSVAMKVLATVKTPALIIR
jgi:nucleotide-binding universal stress UspA family protein